MANLIIGHTTETSTCIWICGEENCSAAQIRVQNGEGQEQPPSEPIDLGPDTDYSAIVPFHNLSPDTDYTVSVCFASARAGLGNSGETCQVHGKFRTFPDPQQDQLRPFSFLLGSCNLSVFTLNSFLSLFLGILGRTVMTQSLKRPLSKWDMDFPKEWWAFFLKCFPRFFRWLSGIAITYGIGFVSIATKGKQPGKPVLKSPFLKLCAIFDSWSIDFEGGEYEPKVGEIIMGYASRATGVLAFSPIVQEGAWKSGFNGPGDCKGAFLLTHVRGTFQTGESLVVMEKTIAMSTTSAAKAVDRWAIGFESEEDEPPVGEIIMGHESRATGVIEGYKPRATGVWAWLVVLWANIWKGENRAGVIHLTQVRGTFRQGECLKAQDKKVARSRSVAAKFPFGYQKPAFIVHAGDQIYFDFPYRKRRPKLQEYRRSYREAWSEDESLRYFLAEYPHYMTLDDHEIYDQFARDRPSPLAGQVNDKDKSPDSLAYLELAEKAYREYVQVRQPHNLGEDSLYYKFQYGAVQYFVFNTRTERHMANQQMISNDQMKCFLAWLREYKEALKFVVSSVPFVAEVGSVRKDHQSAADNEWTSKSRSQNNLSKDHKLKKNDDMSEDGTFERNDDKWSSEFSWDQRERIIEFVYCQQIKRLVFLVGDMHCSYYATMQVGKGTKYECPTIHELAGGPFHQLQLAHQDQFSNLTEHTFKIQSKKIARFTSSEITRNDRWKIYFGSGESEPCVGRVLTGEASGATGVMADSPTLKAGTCWKNKDASGVLLVNQVHGTFLPGELLRIKEDEIPYKTQLDRFYGGANAAMHVTVNYPERIGVNREKLKREPEVEWKVIRTMTESKPVNKGELLRESPAMSGRIRFIERAPVGKP